MANLSKPNITAEMTFEELAVIKKALEGARMNWYFDNEREDAVAASLLSDLGG
ncbi:hypothetical protein [Streptomyces werraensis]|uniref:hypothetical protein n=1 Tax=Streptomyces werraensis TaxID=68284 RepID=UPI0036F5490D